MSRLFFEPAAFGQTGDEGARFFSRFFNQKFGTTNRTFPRNGLVPGCKRAFRKAIASIEKLAALGAAFNNLAGAVRLRTTDADGFTAAVGIERLGIFAFWITAASQKISITASFDHHRHAAFFAIFIRHFLFGRFDGLNDALFIPGVVTGIGAIRVAAAGQKVSVLADFDAQWFLAFRTTQMSENTM